MTRKTKDLYKTVIDKVHELIPRFHPTQVIADFEDAPAAAVRAVFCDDLTMSGCWFHFAQAVVKRLKKVRLTDAYTNEESTQVSYSYSYRVSLLNNCSQRNHAVL